GLLKRPVECRMVAVDIEETPQGFRVKTGADQKPILKNLAEFPDYTRALSGTKMLYHPNEAAADLFGTIVALDMLATQQPVSPEKWAQFEQTFAPMRKWYRDNLK